MTRFVHRWHRRCPAFSVVRPCDQPYEFGKNCQTFVCCTCKRRVPWCFGQSDSDECDDCAAAEV